MRPDLSGIIAGLDPVIPSSSGAGLFAAIRTQLRIPVAGIGHVIRALPVVDSASFEGLPERNESGRVDRWLSWSTKPAVSSRI